jgi:hypothetical protein
MEQVNLPFNLFGDENALMFLPYIKLICFILCTKPEDLAKSAT